MGTPIRYDLKAICQDKVTAHVQPGYVWRLLRWDLHTRTLNADE